MHDHVRGLGRNLRPIAGSSPLCAALAHNRDRRCARHDGNQLNELTMAGLERRHEPGMMCAARTYPPSEPIRRTPHSQPSPVQHMRVNHRRTHIAMAEQLLHRPNVVAVFQEMGRERMPKRMAAHTLRNPRPSHGLSNSPLNDRFVQVVPRWRSKRGSRQIRDAGNTNCQAHSVDALGYLRARANGSTTRPNPPARSS
jgi:hypothetical protein